jgi:exopolyphosphatase/guanosine-5'-triphosphate,3'-diphosphate pyrophosphatase
LTHEDARERSVQAMAARYQVDDAQARRVAATAEILRKQCVGRWQLEMPLSQDILNWSAQLHEIGLDISHDGFQRHGAYVAEHADMPGFPRAEQRFLAFLIGSQRHSINTRSNDKVPQTWREMALRLALILRLAVLLNRSRSSMEMPEIELVVDGHSLALRFDAAWLQENPLTVADLEREQGYLQDVGYELIFS